MKITRGLSALAIGAVLVSQFGLSVSAAQWQKTGFQDVPAYNVGIVNQNDFRLSDAQITSTNPNLKYSPSKWTMFSYGGTSMAPVLYWEGSIAVGQTVTVDGSITALWPNRAITENGDLCDVELTMSNISFNNNSPDTVVDPNIAANSGANHDLFAFRASPAWNSASYDATIRILDHNTHAPIQGEMLMAFFDLDTPDSNLEYSTDASNSEPVPYTEQIGIVDGILSDIYTTPDTLLFVNDSGTRIWGSQMIANDTDPLSEAMFVVNSAGFTFNWRGTGCGTLIFATPEQFTITSHADPGGSITPTQDVFWKSNRTFRTTADEGYYIRSIIVDGQEIPLGDNRKNNTYRFTGVTDNHNIVARFGRLPRLTLNKTTDSQTVKVGDTIEYEITVTNPDQTEDAIGYLITDTLGAGLSYVSDDAGGVQNGQTISWRRTIPAGQSLTIRVRAIVTDEARERVVNAASVTDPDGNEVARQEVENPLEVTNPNTNDSFTGLTAMAVIATSFTAFGLYAFSRRRA